MKFNELTKLTEKYIVQYKKDDSLDFTELIVTDDQMDSILLTVGWSPGIIKEFTELVELHIGYTPAFTMSLINEIKNNKDSLKLLDIIKNRDERFKWDSFKNNKNVIDGIASFYKINSSLVKTIYDFNKKVAGIATGKGELLMQIFVDDCRTSPPNGKGDVWLNSKEIEVKTTNNGRAGSPNYLASYDAIKSKVEERLLQYKSAYEEQFGSTQDLEWYIPSATDTDTKNNNAYNIAQKQLSGIHPIISNADLLSKIKFNKVKFNTNGSNIFEDLWFTLLSSTFKYMDSSTILNKVKTFAKSNGKVNTTDVINATIDLAFINYIDREGFSILTVFNEKTGAVRSLDASTIRNTGMSKYFNGIGLNLSSSAKQAILPSINNFK